MIRLATRVFDCLKAALRRGGSMGFEFPNTQVADIEKEINLKEKARTDGENNLPPENSEVFSNCENEAITKYDERRHSAVLQAANYLDPIKNKIIGYAAILGKTHFFINEFKNRTEQTLNTAVGRLSNLNKSYKTQDQEVKHFKLANNLSRDPRSLTLVKIIIGILFCVGLFLIEVRVNTKLLATAMTGGESEGRNISFAVAALNVFISFLAGYFLVKNLNLAKGTKKIISQITLAVYSFFIIYLNLGLGAFRQIAEDKGNAIKWGETKKIVSQVADLGDPLYFWTVHFGFNAAVLTAIGISFALFSLLDGYFFDDPYPGYGSLGKGRNENKKEIERIREHLPTEVTLLYKNEIKRVGDERNKTLSETLKQWSINVTNLESIFSAYRRFATKISDDLDHIIGEYRSINSNFRKDPTPKYWKDETGKIRTRYYDLSERKTNPEIVFTDMAQLYLNKNQIEESTKEYNNKINEEYNNYIKEINIHKELLDKKITEILAKYDVT